MIFYCSECNKPATTIDQVTIVDYLGKEQAIDTKRRKVYHDVMDCDYCDEPVGMRLAIESSRAWSKRLYPIKTDGEKIVVEFKDKEKIKEYIIER